MFGIHITNDRPHTPVAQRLLGFLRFYGLQHIAPPAWAERRYDEAYYFRPVNRSMNTP